MHHVTLRFAGSVFLLLCSAALPSEPTQFTLSTMPRVDVRAHIRPEWEVIGEYMELRDAIKKQFNAEMAIWISVSGPQPPDLEELKNRYHGRILWTISDYKISDGLKFSAQELADWQKRGVVGFKFYPGWQPGVRVDHPDNLEKIYFRNAMRIYPHVKANLKALGYPVE